MNLLEHPEESEGASSSAPRPKKWTKQDYILLTLAAFIKFGVGTIVFLPGVISSKVACEMDISGVIEQGMLLIILNATLAVSNLVAVPLARAVGERATLLFSLYFSVLVSIAGSMVWDYSSLLTSRAFIGLACGLNITTVGVFGAKRISSTAILPRFSFIHDSVAYTIGTNWIFVMAWLFLDKIGWRAFFLSVSIPILIPPIIILHFIETTTLSPEATSLMRGGNETQPIIENFARSLLKASLFGGFNLFIGYGSVHLLPALHEGDINNGTGIVIEITQIECEDNVVTRENGRQYLLFMAAIGIANLLGRPLGYFLRSNFKFVFLQTAVMLGFAASYATVLSKSGVLVDSIMMTIAKLCYSIQGPERSILHYDIEYFGHSGLSLGGALMQAACLVGGVLSTCIIYFIDPYTAVILILVVSIAQIGVIFSFKERW